MKRKKLLITIGGKMFFVLLYFVILVLMLSVTDAPKYFDSYVFYETFKLEAWLFLMLYRLAVYLGPAFLMTFFELLLFRKRKVKFIDSIIENFNVQFCTYALIAGLYVILGVDKLLGVNIFNSSDIFIFVTGFVFTVLIKKGLPDFIYNSPAILSAPKDEDVDNIDIDN